MVPLPFEIDADVRPTGNAPTAPPRPGVRVPVDGFRDHAVAALRAEGYRMTHQRGALLDLIGRSGGHLDAEALHVLALRHDPRISLSTVYRTLALLKRHDLVAEVHLNEEHHHYEARTGEVHYHLVCRECGGVEEFGAELVESMREILTRDYGFHVQGVDLDVSGTCRRCVTGSGARLEGTVPGRGRILAGA